MKKSSALTRTLGIIAVIVVSLCAVSVALAATELLTNTGFAGSLTGWTIDTNGGGTAAYDGTGAARLDVDSSYVEIYQCVNVTGLAKPPSWVTVTAQYNAPANVGGYISIDSFDQVGCDPLNSNTTNVFASAPNVDGNDAWQPISADYIDVTDTGNITPVRSLKITLGAIENGTAASSAYFDDASAYAASDNGTPNAVTLNNLDAKQANEPSPIWLALIALPLALGVGALVMRRRRA